MPAPAIRGLPCTAGIGLRAPHYREVLHHLPALGWVEVHSENFFGGGAALHTLLRVREHYPISLHGVGLGLASPDALDAKHMADLRRLCDTVQPACVSEHLSWNNVGGAFINDLLPFPYTREALISVAAKVEQVQDALQRPLLLENISSYLLFGQNEMAFGRSEMDEGAFLTEISRRTGCAILFDVNNLYVNARNLGVDAEAYIKSLPAAAVAEYHLAGHSTREGFLVDTHSARVCDEVWALYEFALQHIGERPTLIEWDSDIPELAVLLGEAAQAQKYMEHRHEYAA